MFAHATDVDMLTHATDGPLGRTSSPPFTPPFISKQNSTRTPSTNPYTLTLTTHLLEDIVFSPSGSSAPHTCYGTNIANPEYDHEWMPRVMEHAITSAHSTALCSPSALILILSRWEHTPHRHSKYINSPYTHHLYTLPNDANTVLPSFQHTCTPNPTPFGTRGMVDINLAAKPFALSSMSSHK
jgi:hypothetical protein